MKINTSMNKSGEYEVHFPNFYYTNNGSIGGFEVERNRQDFYLRNFSLPMKNMFYDSNLQDVHPVKGVPVEAGEKLKTFEGITSLINLFQEKGIKRGDTVTVIGGGTMQDAFGFACSIYMRGIKWVFVPTTLLSMADSCIGGKTCINVGETKNIAGNYYPPESIIVDPHFLKTLPEEEIYSGLGEMAHVFVATQDYDSLVKLKDFSFHEPNCNTTIITKSLKAKKEVIEQDEFDNNLRLTLNYGHTLGHALEAASGFTVPHGVAVAYGAILENEFSVDQKLMSRELQRYLHKSLRWVVGLYSIKHGTEWQNPDPNLLIEHLKKDKKNKDNEIGLIVLKEGRPELRHYKVEVIKSFLENASGK